MKAWIKYAKYVSGKMKSAQENKMEYIPSESDEGEYVVEDSDDSEYEESDENSRYSENEIKEEEEEKEDSNEFDELENLKEISKQKSSTINLKASGFPEKPSIFEEEKDGALTLEEKSKETSPMNINEGQEVYPKILYSFVEFEKSPKVEVNRMVKENIEGRLKVPFKHQSSKENNENGN